MKQRTDFAVIALIEERDLRPISRRKFQRAQNRDLSRCRSSAATRRRLWTPSSASLESNATSLDPGQASPQTPRSKEAKFKKKMSWQPGNRQR